MKIGITILLIGFVSCAMSQELAKVIQFLNKADSFEEAKLWGLENPEVKVSTLIVSDNSLMLNDSLFSYLGYYCLSDSASVYTHIETQNVGEVIELDEDSLKVFHKLIALDSVLCYNVATIDLGFNYQHTNSVFEDVKSSLENGLSWNSLPYHYTDSYNPTGVEGALGWIEKDIYTVSFTSAIENHEVSDVFVFKDDDEECYGGEEYSVIVYKLEEDKYFKRYSVIQVVIKD